ncbi:MAG: methionyl-tRNA formyltransferase [Pseudomonadota bacterium]|nr:methionyl-tRNA formyltransferase [Gammaproteobacteria bacterium]MBU1629028.1 methionyl-tRNA formyltransferase [Gammaproteobacteria bacterium]MBU2546674.1 methionyl-tRNA formyltransferase [Gammaproteobacteria bacterium]
MKHPLKIVFAGTPSFAAQHLEALIHSHRSITAVFTQPDKNAGRGRKMQASAVKQLAQQHHLPIYQPISLKEPSAIQTFQQLAPDLLIVIAYGLVLPKEVLDIPRLGCINVHASLLPRWRGAAPIQRAILNGDTETGITIMQMDKGLDTGPMLTKASCAIELTDTAETLENRLITLGKDVLLKTLTQFEQEKEIPFIPQNEENACYAKKITKEEAEIHWEQSAIQIDRHIRAFNPAPIAFTTIQSERIRIWKASALPMETQEAPGKILQLSPNGIDVATGGGVIRLEVLQFPGGKALPAKEILNSRRVFFEKHCTFDTHHYSHP